MRIFFTIILFILCCSIPLLWSDEVSFDIVAFTTEYYRTLANLFIIGFIAYLMKYNYEHIEKNLTKPYKKRKAISAINNLNDFEMLTFETLIKFWEDVYQNKQLFDFNNQKLIEKLNAIITKTNEYTFMDKKKSSEFQNLLINLKENVNENNNTK